MLDDRAADRPLSPREREGGGERVGELPLPTTLTKERDILAQAVQEKAASPTRLSLSRRGPREAANSSFRAFRAIAVPAHRPRCRQGHRRGRTSTATAAGYPPLVSGTPSTTT